MSQQNLLSFNQHTAKELKTRHFLEGLLLLHFYWHESSAVLEVEEEKEKRLIRKNKKKKVLLSPAFCATFQHLHILSLSPYILNAPWIVHFLIFCILPSFSVPCICLFFSMSLLHWFVVIAELSGKRQKEPGTPPSLAQAKMGKTFLLSNAQKQFHTTWQMQRNNIP